MTKQTNTEPMPEIILAPLPCGCAVDLSNVAVWCRRTILECPWCGATFRTKDYQTWFNGDAPIPLWLENAPRSSLRN